MVMETCQITSAQCTLAANLATLDEQLYLTAQIRPDPIASDRSRPEQNKITWAITITSERESIFQAQDTPYFLQILLRQIVSV